MPTKASRARRWLKEGKAVIYKNDLHFFAVQLTTDSREETQPIAVGIDPGKNVRFVLAEIAGTPMSSEV